MGDPRGQFGSFLRNWLDRQSDRGDAKRRIAKAAGVTERAVGKWEEGLNSPPLQSLDPIARTMGYSNWGKLAMAAVRYCESL
jgi:transcriptional regulator with XRE-family HTH domain